MVARLKQSRMGDLRSGIHSLSQSRGPDQHGQLGSENSCERADRFPLFAAVR